MIDMLKALAVVTFTGSLVVAAELIEPPGVARPVEESDGQLAVPAFLEKGDLLFCDCRNESSPHAIPGMHNDRVSIYIGSGLFVEAVPDENVWITDMKTTASWAKNIVFGHVAGSSPGQRQAAVSFALAQLGKPYQYFPWLKIADPETYWYIPTANQWYYSELAWAAYYNQGIDIDWNEWDIPCQVMPQEILDDDDFELH